MLDQIGSLLTHIDELESKAYLNNDLGMTYKEGVYTFKVWSPFANEVYLNLYQTGDINDNSLIRKIKMNHEDNVWAVGIDTDLDGMFYTYSFNIKATKHRRQIYMQKQ